MGITLLDHLIIGRNRGYFSFADAGDTSPQTAGYRGMVLRRTMRFESDTVPGVWPLIPHDERRQGYLRQTLTF